MALTPHACYEVIRHHLDGAPGTPVEMRAILNQAGHVLCDAHDWRWLRARAATLVQRSPLEVSGATYTHTGRTLTATGAFANYAFEAGDTFEWTSGGSTALLDGLIVEVVSKTDDNTIVLGGEGLRSAADGATDIGGRLPNDLVPLPGDFKRLIAYAAENGLERNFSASGAQAILDLRSIVPSISTISFWGFVGHALASGVPSFPILEVYPSAERGANLISIIYEATWRLPSSDVDVLVIPEWLELLFLRILRAVADGYEREDQGALEERLEPIYASTLFERATYRDGMEQVDLGPIGGGALGAGEVSLATFQRNQLVPNPS